MVRDDLEACLQAYRFAELVLGGFRQKDEKSRQQALAAAEGLTREVEDKYRAVLTGSSYAAAAVTSLQALRARLDEKLREARRTMP